MDNYGKAIQIVAFLVATTMFCLAPSGYTVFAFVVSLCMVMVPYVLTTEDPDVMDWVGAATEEIQEVERKVVDLTAKYDEMAKELNTMRTAVGFKNLR